LSDAFPAIIIVELQVSADDMFGLTDAFTTRMPCKPWVRN